MGKISLLGIPDKPGTKEFRAKIKSVLGDVSICVKNDTSEIEKKMILFQANQAIANQFDYLGSGIKQFETTPWHQDLKNGYVWPQGKFYLDYSIAESARKGADIKFPWELSRGHHLLWLGEAYLLTGEEKYAQKVTESIEDWIDKNPLFYSVNWVCAMDVAIRAVNWMYAIAFVADSHIVDDDFVAKVYKSLYQHQFFIKHNLENDAICPGNHYAANVAGMIYLSALFGKKSDTRYFAKEYEDAVIKQVLPSGVHFEMSVSYHLLTTELFAYPLFVLKRMGVKVSTDVEGKVMSMFSFIASYIQKNGFVPMVGDNDDGRLLPFVKRDFREHGYIISRDCLENKLLFLNSKSPDFSNFQSKLFSDAGFAVLRNESSDLFVSLCSDGKRNGHRHNDSLSFVLSLYGCDFIVDPGAYIYTPDIAKHIEFRSTAKHNTIMVDGEEQNIISNRVAFTRTSNSIAEQLSTEVGEYCSNCSGRYVSMSGKLSHQRKFELKDKSLYIEDYLQKNGADHKAELYLHFASGLIPEIVNGVVTVDLDDKRISISFDSPGLMQSELFEDTVSPSYGVILPSMTLRMTLYFSEKIHIATNIMWN